MSRFSQEQIHRYSRQILLREVGGHGQIRLGAARPVLLCRDEVGQIAAEYLWRAGITELALLAPTAAHAARLTEHLVATGYPGPAAQPITQAAESLQNLATAAPSFTAVWLPAQAPDFPGAADASSPAGLLLWACCQATWGAIGQGEAALYKLAAEHPATGPASSATGSGAMILGSALALLTVQRILGTSAALTAAGQVWQIDLTSPSLPTWR